MVLEDPHYLSLALKHYEASFAKSNAARHFVERKLGISLATAKTLGFGFGDRTLSQILPPLNSSDGDRIRGALQRVGFLKSNGRERFRGALTLPVFQNGKLRNVFGYWFGQNLKSTRTITEVMCNNDGALYNVDAIKEGHTVNLCLTPFDAITLHALGVKPAVSSLSSLRFSEANVACLLRYGIRNIKLCIPNSESGRRFARAVGNSVSSVGLLCEVLKTHDVIPLYRANATLRHFTRASASLSNLGEVS
jgi:hypothetical protein